MDRGAGSSGADQLQADPRDNQCIIALNCDGDDDELMMMRSSSRPVYNSSNCNDGDDDDTILLIPSA